LKSDYVSRSTWNGLSGTAISLKLLGSCARCLKISGAISARPDIDGDGKTVVTVIAQAFGRQNLPASAYFTRQYCVPASEPVETRYETHAADPSNGELPQESTILPVIDKTLRLGLGDNFVWPAVVRVNERRACDVCDLGPDNHKRPNCMRFAHFG
jgi:hypothetical protein